MQNLNIISSQSEQDIIDQVNINKFKEDSINYSATLVHKNSEVSLNIDIDAEGGLGHSMEFTDLVAIVSVHDGFTFSVTKRTLFSKLKRLFGYKYLKTANKILDDNFAIKTNNPELLVTLLNDKYVTDLLVSLKSFTLTLGLDKSGNSLLTFSVIEPNGYTADLEKIYHAFNILLSRI